MEALNEENCCTELAECIDTLYDEDPYRIALLNEMPSLLTELLIECSENKENLCSAVLKGTSGYLQMDDCRCLEHLKSMVSTPKALEIIRLHLLEIVNNYTEN